MHLSTNNELIEFMFMNHTLMKDLRRRGSLKNLQGERYDEHSCTLSTAFEYQTLLLFS